MYIQIHAQTENQDVFFFGRQGLTNTIIDKNKQRLL